MQQKHTQWAENNIFNNKPGDIQYSHSASK